MNKIYWIDIKYYHETTGLLIGHSANVKSRRELKEVLDRWGIRPERVECFRLNDQLFDLDSVFKEMDW